MQCLRCGQCCITATITLNNVPWGRDEKQLGKWLALHRCWIEQMEGKLSAKIPLTCVWLIFDKDTGIASCFEYDNRPVICREYFCPRAQGK